MMKHGPLRKFGWVALAATIVLAGCAAGDEGVESVEPLAQSLSSISVSSFTLVNATTDQDIGALQSGDVIDLDQVGQALNVRANTSGSVAQVRFGLDGVSNYRTEGVAPYALEGDRSGDYYAWTPSLGSHTLTATPLNAAGEQGTPLTITFEVVEGGAIDPCQGVVCNTPPSRSCQGPEAVSYVSPGMCQGGSCVYAEVREACDDSGQVCAQGVCVAPTSDLALTLVNADTDADISPLSDGATLDLAALGESLSVRADVSVSFASVTFTLDGALIKTENVAPYAIAGDSPQGDYNPWTPALGSRQLTVRAHSAAGGSGSVVAEKSVSFEVVSGSPPPSNAVTVTGEKRLWHPITFTFQGPSASEQGGTNPFLDSRFDLRFEHLATGRVVKVPGYFAADGDAADSHASSGSSWRAKFSPDAVGTWRYTASFRQGSNVAISLSATAGSPASFDGATGTFQVSASNKTGRDLRAKGLLSYAEDHHLQFMGDGTRFLKGGAGSPENFLAYHQFDATFDGDNISGWTQCKNDDLGADGLHHYAPHVSDWRSGDPSWSGGKGKGIIGAVNYLADQGMTSFYLLSMTANGDGCDVWPWTEPKQTLRYDVSKLDQWEQVLEYMNRRGIVVHMLQQETENDQLLDGGALGTERKLYYRELIARFSHLPGLIWNLGEETTNTDAQRVAFADYISALDPYDHPLVVHTYPGDKNKVYTPLLGVDDFDGASLQIGQPSSVYSETLKWYNDSEAASRPWACFLDEIGPANVGAKPDSADPDHDDLRKQALWGNLMAGGGGAEWYFGYSFAHDDLNAEDFRSRANLWAQTRHALSFFTQQLPFWTMSPQPAALSSATGYVLADPGQVYAVYLKSGGQVSLTLPSGNYTVRWYNPRSGGALQTGTISTVSGGGARSIGLPPSSTSSDWAAVIKRS